MVELLILSKAIPILVHYSNDNLLPASISRVPFKMVGSPTTFEISLRINLFSVISTLLIKRDNTKFVKLHIDSTGLLPATLP